MTINKWAAGLVGAVSLTAMAGSTAFALQDGSNGGNGGNGGAGGQIDNNDMFGGEAEVNADGACDENEGEDNSSGVTRCSGFGARAGNGGGSLRSGNGARGGRGGGGGRGGDRVSRRTTSPGFFGF